MNSAFRACTIGSELSTVKTLRKKDTNLASRHKIERDFHDSWAKKIKINDVNFIGVFESSTALENKFALKNMGNIFGKNILDLGCGMGDASIYFALNGARVYSVDISPGMISVVNELAKKLNLEKEIVTKVMVAEKLDIKDEFFDVVFGNGILHHVDVELALNEVFRVLKKNGVAIFIEPLGHNPIINVYRKIANQVRTTTERPLNYGDLSKLTRAKFSRFEHQEFHLFTLLVFVWFYFIERISPNQERYWKKIIDDEKEIKSKFAFLNNIDKIILKLLPFLKRYCWNCVLIYEK